VGGGDNNNNNNKHTLVVGRSVLLVAVLECCTYSLCSHQLWAPGPKVGVTSSFDGC